MESRMNADSLPVRAALPPGRLGFEPVATALLADGMVDPLDDERLRAAMAATRHGSDIHPLVLLAKL